MPRTALAKQAGGARLSVAVFRFSFAVSRERRPHTALGPHAKNDPSSTGTACRFQALCFLPPHHHNDSLNVQALYALASTERPVPQGDQVMPIFLGTTPLGGASHHRGPPQHASRGEKQWHTNGRRA